jgi:hypothetical protein
LPLVPAKSCLFFSLSYLSRLSRLIIAYEFDVYHPRPVDNLPPTRHNLPHPATDAARDL